jgi:holo-[acyl-carrier protein] synthase
MIHAVGLDIVETERMERDIASYGNRFVERILGEQERSLYDRRVDKSVFLAGRFACKEAIIKALGFRLKDRPPYADLQIINDPTGRPILDLPPALASQLGPIRFLISISHEQHYAVAVAIITEDS